MTLPPLDDEGFLASRSDWTDSIAHLLAEEEGISLTNDHWIVINIIQAFFNAYDHSPNNRALVNFVKRQHNEVLGNSTSMMRLFGGKPARTAARIAGLPRPEHCL